MRPPAVSTQATTSDHPSTVVPFFFKALSLTTITPPPPPQHHRSWRHHSYVTASGLVVNAPLGPDQEVNLWEIEKRSLEWHRSGWAGVDRDTGTNAGLDTYLDSSRCKTTLSLEGIKHRRKCWLKNCKCSVIFWSDCDGSILCVSVQSRYQTPWRHCKLDFLTVHI